MMSKRRSASFILVDVLLILMILLPLFCGMVIKILTTPPTDEISIAGAQIYFIVPMPLQDMPITESQVNSWLVILSLLGVCLYLTHGLSPTCETRRQHFAEMIVEATDNMVNSNMGAYFKAFSPFICAIMALSAFSSLLTLIGLYPPTSDLNVVGGWALLVFFLITYYKFKCGPIHYLKSFAEPPALTPLNVISEIATPISMAFRHYGNVLSGSVISVLLAAALGGLSVTLFGNLPGILGKLPQVFPILRVGIPAILSLYFDIFSGCLQAFIFAMLTMLYVAGAFPAEDYARKMEKIKNKNKKTN